MTYAETVPRLVPIEFKSSPSYVKYTLCPCKNNDIFEMDLGRHRGSKSQNQPVYLHFSADTSSMKSSIGPSYLTDIGTGIRR